MGCLQKKLQTIYDGPFPLRAMQYKPLALVSAALLVVALADLPYGFYTVLRLIVCGTAAYGAWMASETDRTFWTFLLGGIALLFNPVVPVYLDRSVWAVLDLGSAAVLGRSAFRLDGEAEDTR